MAAFSRGWAFTHTPISFRLPICRRCIVRATTPQKRTLTSSLTHRTISVRPKKNSQTNFLHKTHRNASSKTDSSKATPSSGSPSNKRDPASKSRPMEFIAEKARAFLAQMNQNPALITPHALASQLELLKTGQILYEAPSQRRYVTVALFTAAMFLSMGVGAVYIRETEPGTQPWWILLANGVVVLSATGFGLFVLNNTMGLCKRITALPAVKARDGLRVVVEGYYFWVPWKRRIVEAELGDLVMAKTMAYSQNEIRRRPVHRIPDDEVSPFILRFHKFGREFGACAREIPNACFRQTHPLLVIRKGKRAEEVTFKLDITGQAFGGAKGFDRLVYAAS